MTDDLNNKPTEQQKAQIRQLIATFLSHKQKEKMLSKFEARDIAAVYNAGIAITYATERLISKAKREEDYARILASLKHSRKRGKLSRKIISELETRTRKVVNQLEAMERSTSDEILGPQKEHYDRIRMGSYPHKEEACAKIWNDCIEMPQNRNYVRQLELIEQDLSRFRSGSILILNDDLLKLGTHEGERDLLESFAFVIFEPKYQAMSLTFLDMDWPRFPIKWSAYRLPIPHLLDLFDMFKNGEDVTELYLKDFESQGLEDLTQLSDDPILQI